jgi:hypothetical protein
MMAMAAAIALCAPATTAHAQAVFNAGGVMFRAEVTSLRDMPFRTVVRQQYDYSCGSAALATLLRYHYGRSVNEAQVFQAMYLVGDQAKIRQVGFSLLDMKRYLESVGLAADGYRETAEDLAQSDAPAIAVISVGAYRHFVVVKGVRPGAVLVGDPALGLKSYRLDDFMKVWNGVIFVVHPKADSPAFNRADEWGSFPHASTDALDEESLAQFTRGLPPMYQITARNQP